MTLLLHFYKAVSILLLDLYSKIFKIILETWNLFMKVNLQRRLTKKMKMIAMMRVTGEMITQMKKMIGECLKHLTLAFFAYVCCDQAYQA